MGNVKIQHENGGGVGEVPEASLDFWRARGYRPVIETQLVDISDQEPEAPVVDEDGDSDQGQGEQPDAESNGTAADSADDTNNDSPAEGEQKRSRRNRD